MLLNVGYLAAFTVGLLGGVHCAGMCGGIVGALTLGFPVQLRSRPVRMLPFILGYNAGRIASYTVAGALMGGISYAAMHFADLHQLQRLLQLAAGLFMVALGLYLGGWWHGLIHIERLGAGFWRHLQPLAHRLLPPRTLPQAVLLGTVWGWLPCGLVYSVLIWAITAGSALQGALLMLSFGLGTLPMLLTMGALYAWLAAALRNPWIRRGAGALVVLFGVHSLGSAL